MHEVEYVGSTSVAHRKDYGQFFTPLPVARLMIQWVLADGPASVLDPAFGLGIFYDAAEQSRSFHHLQRFVGYEIDDRILSHFARHASSDNLEVRNQDYLGAEVGTFDGIVCNPPYMRFQKFLNRFEVLPRIELQIGGKLLGYANVASVFLVKSLHELSEHGRLAFVMPFEFFNAGYGREIKRQLLHEHLLKQIIVFSNEKEIFPDAVTTVCVLLCQRNRRAEPIKFTQIGSLAELDQIRDVGEHYQRQIEAEGLPFDQKWTPILRSLFAEREHPDEFVKLSCYGTFKRGLATGANAFFGLAKTTAEQWGLDPRDMRKCITRSRQIRKPVFTDDDFCRLYEMDQPVHCLAATRHDDQRLREYIAEGERQGYHRRYLTRVRNVWYELEHRTPAPILFGVFSRGRLKVVRNLTDSVNFACFHAFYPNVFGAQLVDKLFVYLLSDRGQEILKANKRSYGDDLDKFEPGDLNECLCPNQAQLDLLDGDDVKNILEVAKTDEKAAILMSNALMENIFAVGRSLLGSQDGTPSEEAGVGDVARLRDGFVNTKAGCDAGRGLDGF